MRLLVLIGALVSLAISHDATAACPAVFAGGVAPIGVSATVLVCHTSYALGYAPAWGEPAWSAERLTADQARAGEAAKRNGAFHVDDQLPAEDRVAPSVYAHSGYDLGHMSPAGDFGPDKPETFSTANMVPQAPNLNRKIWAGIEAAVRALAIADGELYVITGPEIDATAVRLAGKVSVPSKTWKAVDEPGRGAAAYVCTNTAAPICSAESIAALSAEIGFDPFPGLPEALKATAIALPEPTKGGELADVQEGDR